jgi:L-lactate dehydrogenase complex protein LldG
MNPERRHESEQPADSLQGSDVAAFIDLLRDHLRGYPAEARLPERVEATVRQVDSGVATGETPVPHDVAAGASPAEDSLTARFTRSATSIGAQVHSTTTVDWIDDLARLLTILRAESVAIPPADDGFFDATRIEKLEQRLASEGITAKRETDDDTLFSVDAAITCVVAAIAESGTLVCQTAANTARGSSLIPPVHVAVVEAAQVLPDLCDYLQALGERPELPAAVSLITGPSKTADIEGVLVTGVHGPGQVHIVVVES